MGPSLSARDQASWVALARRQPLASLAVTDLAQSGRVYAGVYRERHQRHDLASPIYGDRGGVGPWMYGNRIPATR
jgi:hypothetical protein